MSDIEQRLAAVEQRNTRVESDKAWETSWLRRVVIVVFTYVTVVLYGLAIGAERPALNAVVPCVGFFLSTLTIPMIKRRWIKRQQTTRP